MPKLPRDTNDPAPVAEAVERTISTIAITTNPVVICGVNRKVNIGNFETVDIYAAVALPTPMADASDLESFRAVLQQVAQYGFELTSGEANQRYNLIKELQRGQKPPEDV